MALTFLIQVEHFYEYMWLNYYAINRFWEDNATDSQGIIHDYHADKTYSWKTQLAMTTPIGIDGEYLTVCMMSVCSILASLYPS